jgi:hypothetical protein
MRCPSEIPSILKSHSKVNLVRKENVFSAKAEKTVPSEAWQTFQACDVGFLCFWKILFFSNTRVDNAY